MAENKTRETGRSVDAFLQAIENEERRRDCEALRHLMADVTGHEPRMWGPSMIGFGSYHYRYDSGREGDWFLTGFAPRKQDLTLYIMAGFDRYERLMAKLGRHKVGKSCLYIKRLSDVDEKGLRELITASVQHTQKQYGASPN